MNAITPTNSATPQPTPKHRPLQPPSVLLIGGPGSGKTYSISTLIESGLDVFVLVTEPVGLDSLLDVVAKKNLNIHKLHYKVISPARPGFAALLDSANKVATMGFEDLSKLRPTAGRSNAQWLEMLRTLSNFVCDRTGDSFGSVDSWNDSRVLVIDSLSGLNTMAMDLTIGDKPTAHQGEWGVAMQMLDKLLLSLTSGLKCPLVITAHLEKETNEISGAVQIMASTLGRKLAPKLPRFFSEVVMAYREGPDFLWSTTATNADLKNRALPLSGKIPPTFKPIIDTYNRRVLMINSNQAQGDTTNTHNT